MSDYENINRWRDYCTTGRHNGNVLSLARCNVFASGNRLHSYGSHFTLATWLPDVRLFVINGDRSSVTTNRHNREVISALRGHDTVIIPYSALGGARIDVATIRPVDVRPDRTERIAHSVATLADVPRWRRARTLYRDATAETLDNVPRQYHDTGYREIATGATLEVDYSTYPHTYRTADGRALNTADADTCEWIARIPLVDGLYRWSESYSVEDGRHLLNADTGRYEWIEDRHVLGDSLFTAVSAGRRRTWLSSFDYQERNPLYYLCELPRGHGAATVEDAIAALMPPSVAHAVANGRDVKRQGDIFAVPVDIPDAILYGRARGRARLTQWTRGSKPRTGEIGFRKPLTWRQIKWRMAARDRYVRTVFRERMASYLATAATVAQPKTDSRARANYRRWRNNAEPYRGWLDAMVSSRDAYRARTRGAAGAILATVRTEARLRYPIASGYTEEDRARLRDTLSIHGTAHSCTEMVVTAGGVTYGRGILYHAVSLEGGMRDADHARVSLGDRWHVMVRNTVPRQRNA